MKKVKKNEGKPKKVRVRKEVRRFMWSQAFHELYPLTVGGLALVVSSYSNQTVPTLIGKLLDPASPRSKQNTSFVANVVWVGLIGGAASFLRTFTLNQAQESIASRLRKESFKSLLMNHDLEWFHTDGEKGNDDENDSDEPTPKDDSDKDEKNVAPTTTPSSSLGMTPGAIGVILRDDVEAVASTMTTTVANLFRSSSSCIFSSCNMILLNPNLFGLSLAVAPVVGSLALMTRKYIKKIAAMQQEAALDAASFVEERLNHIAMVKMSNREEDEIDTYGLVQDKLVSLAGKSAFANGLSMGTMFFLSTSALCGILMAGGKAVEAKRMDHGQLVSFGTYSFLLALGSAGVIKAMGEYSRGMQSATRIYDLIHPESIEEASLAKAEGKGAENSVDPSTIRDLRLENLNFSYRSDSNAEILRNISLKLSRGEIVAMVGKNGAGKSTIAMLLAGLYKPSGGRIVVDVEQSAAMGTFDEIDLHRDINRDARSKLVQVVPQHPAIFGTTILDNVRYSTPTASEEDVKKALEATNAQSFLSRFEGGLSYQVGRNGSRLSGGQRQRLGLARAMLANPSFLVLDEPASSLDMEGENAVLDAIKACRDSDRSLLVITHRAKTVELADRVVVLKDGQIAEQGTYRELLENNGELCALMPDLG
mmetsp:Transcript_29632/g.85247  ORF Transcript_29632/g.85247 Transcript_29632/m.85247 type:complete len:650 (-) Transcript_29632:40-1989(-)|eukprot:CAMPEP_0176004064 /NCGR_PEP_ID=MMETSP0120_2-20121206/1498_1 /TAXON_ID=160619 /ORGANISM="Kryptoperidinium foliaceum, Strain CCMP 1326" /LENGTH=649 /DNA_ID=CAMNT_0017336729 /DNA_START=135 /DNA_END=2084 /DNA_ORIENTATION=-